MWLYFKGSTMNAPSNAVGGCHRRHGVEQLLCNAEGGIGQDMYYQGATPDRVV